MPLIAVNGIELYYESRGTGAPLLVLAGLGARWRVRAGMMVADLPVLRGHTAGTNGSSPRSARS